MSCSYGKSHQLINYCNLFILQICL